jgi:hypothetical protein
MSLDARQYRADVVLRDGGSILIRAIRADDRARLLAHFRGLGPVSAYRRFHGAKKRLTDEELTHFTELDFVRRVALVATLRRDGEERIIGVGRYDVTVDDPRTYTRPWRGAWTISWVADRDIEEFFCEENAESTFVR